MVDTATLYASTALEMFPLEENVGVEPLGEELRSPKLGF